MQKRSTISILLSLLLVSSNSLVLAQDNATPTGKVPLNGKVSSKKSDKKDEEKANYDPMEKLLEIPEVAKIKESCLNVSAGSDPINLPDCIWSEVQGNPALLEKVQQVVTEIDKSNKNAKKYESLQLNPMDNSQEEKDPAVKKLEDYLAQKLNEAMYGTEKKKNMVGHDNYYQLYKTQVGKNLINSMSEFCLDSNFMEITQGVAQISMSYSDRKEQRKRNIKALGEGEIKLFSTGKGDSQKSIQSLWTGCIASIKSICDNKISQYLDDAKTTATPSVQLKSNCPENSNCGYTQRRACLVAKRAQETRQNLQLADKILDRLDQIAQEGTGRGFAPEHYEMKTFVAEGETSANALTTLTSKEALNDSGYQEEAQAQFENFKNDCYDYDQETGQLIGTGKDAEKCQKYVGVNRRKLASDLSEYKLRLEAQRAKVNGDEFSEEEIRTYLAEQGYSEEEIEQKLKVNGGSDYIKEMITNRYNQEVDQSLAAIREEILGTTVKGESVDLNDDDDKKSLSNVGQRLADKAEEFKQLIHFNNVVSSFLEIKDDKDNRSRNVIGLKKELENSAYNESGRNTASSSGSDFSQNMQGLQQRVDESGVNLNGSEDSVKDGTSTELGIKDINEVFDYTKSK